MMPMIQINDVLVMLRRDRVKASYSLVIETPQKLYAPIVKILINSKQLEEGFLESEWKFEIID